MSCLLKEMRPKHRSNVPFVEATKAKNTDRNACSLKQLRLKTSTAMPVKATEAKNIDRNACLLKQLRLKHRRQFPVF